LHLYCGGFSFACKVDLIVSVFNGGGYQGRLAFRAIAAFFNFLSLGRTEGKWAAQRSTRA